MSLEQILGSVLVGAVVIGIVVLIIIKMIKDKKNNKGGCTGDCSRCKGCK